MIFQTKNATILSYVPYSGGKFLSNCLSLSKHACPQDPFTAEYLLNHPDDYEYRLQSVLKTLPPHDKLLQWRSYEFGDIKLYGSAFVSWNSGQIGDVNRLTMDLCRSHMKFFICNHAMDPSNLVKIWNNATVVRLINVSRFQKICLAKKNSEHIDNISEISGNFCQEKYEQLKGNDWPSWNKFEGVGYDVRYIADVDDTICQEIGKFYPLHHCKNPVTLYNVDSNYFETDKFLLSIKELYQKLNLNDFNPDLVKYFYTKYMELHT